MFEMVLSEEGNPRHLDALLGRAKLLEKFKQFENCLVVLSEITVLYPNFKPAFIEKGKIHIQNSEWDNSLEAITNVLMSDRQNCEALRIFCFFLLVRENDLDAFREKFEEL